ncbi:hypothetical protein OFN53_34000, partial [Escherichia coli]|nr:hypothetical protein [Escherichia coli]
MNPVGSNPVNSYAKQPAVVAQNQDHQVDTVAAPLKVEQNKVTLSTEGKALLAALQQIDHESKKVEAENKTMG